MLVPAPLPLWLTPGAWRHHSDVAKLLPPHVVVRHLTNGAPPHAASTPGVVVLDVEEGEGLTCGARENPLVGLIALQRSAGSAKQVIDLLDRGVDRVLIAPADAELAVQIRKLARRLQARAVWLCRIQPAPLAPTGKAAS